MPHSTTAGPPSSTRHAEPASGTHWKRKTAKRKRPIQLPAGFGTLTNFFAADRFRGAVVRYSGFLKTVDVRGWAGLWLRVDGENDEMLRFDNMSYPVDRSIAGSTEWAQYEIVLDVPVEAARIFFGFLLSGTGTVWADDLEFEILHGGLDSGSQLAVPGLAQVQALGLPPAEASYDSGDSPVTAGDGAAGDSGGRELFLGRTLEQDEFRNLLGELSRAAKKPGHSWSQVMIIHGIGGIGKTRLCERFHKIAVEGVSRDRYEVIRVDWADIRTLDPGLGRAALFEAALDELERECSRNGKIASYFEQFRQLRVRLARVRAQVEPMGSGLGGDTQPDTALGRSAKLAGSVLQTGEVFGVPPGVGEAAQAAGAAVDALSAMWKNGESWLRNRLAPEDYELLVRPLDLLASAFAAGLAKAAARRPIVLLADTCEIVSPAGPWLRASMRESGPRVAWVLSGRFEADPPGLSTELGFYSDYVPGGQLSELSAYRKAVPGERLRVHELGAFDAHTLRAYLIRAAPHRQADDGETGRLLTATAGIPLAVRLAASLWAHGVPIETIADPVPIGTDRRAVVEGMTKRFLVHLSGTDKEKIYGLALLLYPDDADLIAAIWDTSQVTESFESLALRYDFVLAGQYRLHDTIQAFLARYLLGRFQRPEVRRINQRAVACLEQRLADHHENLPTLEQRLKDRRWIADMLALAWHRFWADNQQGWAALRAAFPAAIVYNRAVGRALLDIARRFIPFTADDEQRQLRLLSDTVGPITALFGQSGADAFSWLGRDDHHSPVEPDTGCTGERLAILQWLNGQYALHNNDLLAAFRHLTSAAAQSPESATQLRRWIGRSLVDLSRRLPSEPPATSPRPEDASYATAQLAVKMEPDSPDAQRQWGTVLSRIGREEDALKAFDTSIELDGQNADAHIDRAEALIGLVGYEDALQAVERALSIDPSNARATAVRGNIHRLTERYEAAIEDLNGVIGCGYEQAWVFVIRGVTHLCMGNHDKALTDFGKAIELDVDYGTAFHARAQAYYVIGRYDEALADIDQALALVPGDSAPSATRDRICLAIDDPLTARAVEWMLTASWDESESFLAGHFELLSSDAQVTMAALAEVNADNEDVALHARLLAAARHSGVTAAYARLRAKQTTERLPEVVQDWMACAPDWPSSAAYHAEHANSLSEPACVQAMADACYQEPADPHLWIHRGLMLLGENRPDGYASVSTGRPDPFQQARALLATGNHEKALAWASLARARDRGLGALLMAEVQLNHQQPDQATEALYDATTHVSTGHLADVLAAYQTLLHARPREPLSHAGQAYALELAEQPAGALAAYDQAISLDSGNPSLYFNKGTLLFGLGRYDEAASCLSEALRLRPGDVLGARVLLGAIAWPTDQAVARDHFEAALSSPGTLLVPWTKALFRSIAMVGVGRSTDAKRELEGALSVASAAETQPDGMIRCLLHQFETPPLPGLDSVRILLTDPPTSADAL
jgi:tetratricopeptide (TPR) repeat protein